MIAVLKQECREVYREVLALTRRQAPAQVVERDGRRVALGDLGSLRFTDRYPGPVRVVKVREQWAERHRVGQE